MKKFLAEFKEFINRGSVMDMAVGVIVGAAFQAIVNSLVSDIISPLIGIIFKMDFSGLSVTVRGSEIMYGSFIMAILNFLIVAFVLFLVVKGMNMLRRGVKKPAEEAPAAPTTKICPFCKSEIPIDATRCPHCTSEQPETVEEK